MIADLVFHHLGIAVFSIDKTATIYEKCGYVKSEVIFDPEQNVNVCTLTKEGMPILELLEPVDDKSPVCKILEKSGVSTYHHCYQVSDIKDAIDSFRALKFIPTTRIKYSNVFDSNVCFLFNREVGLIELLTKK